MSKVFSLKDPLKPLDVYSLSVIICTTNTFTNYLELKAIATPIVLYVEKAFDKLA